MYNCIAALSRFYYPETQRLINDFIIIINVVWPSVSQAELASIQRIHCCLVLSFTDIVSINTTHTLLFGHQFHWQS